MKNVAKKIEAMTVEEQTRRWVAGDSVHNSTRNECCPDFSCCQPSLMAPLEVRKAFAAAGEAERHMMLSQFMGGLILSIPKRRAK